jgi:hypothetical protein
MLEPRQRPRPARVHADESAGAPTRDRGEVAEYGERLIAERPRFRSRLLSVGWAFRAWSVAVWSQGSSWRCSMGRARPFPPVRRGRGAGAARHRSLRTITSCNPFASGARLPRLVRGKPPTGFGRADCPRIPRMGFSTESTRSGDEFGWSRCCFGKRICRADGSPTRPLRLGRFRGGLRALPRRCPCTRSASDHPAWIRRRAAPLAERRGRGAGRLTARPRRSKHGRHGRNWQHR